MILLFKRRNLMKKTIRVQTMDLLSSFSADELDLLTVSGSKLIEDAGLEVIREIIYDVLTGKNLRDSTEMLTRHRVSTLNLAIFKMFARGSAKDPDFIEKLPQIASEILQRKRGVSKNEKLVAQWILGLTGKACQNVLRDDNSAIDSYRDKYMKTCQEVIRNCEEQNGTLTGTIELDSGNIVSLNWPFITYLLNTVGSETLTIRGSEKSANGKLYGSLVLGCLLSILGFKLLPEQNPAAFDGKIHKVFWLSSTSKRESDATLLFEAGKGIRFDIGFIGRGNPEISLDKVTRFEKQISIGKSNWYLATIIFVDTIGGRSKIRELAEEVDGKIIQMSMGYWPQAVAQELATTLNYEHDLATMDQSQIGDYLWDELKKIDLLEIIRVAKL
jgi:hypothetical protein